MKKLSKERCQKAVAYIKEQARPLEKQLYRFHFEEGTLKDVIHELAQFQNEDGGFGKALEPDVHLPDSSVLATTVAFQHFRGLDLSSSNEIVQKACRYLINTYDEANQVWPIIPQNVDDAPHAPWWAYSQEWSNYLVNPRAEIVGYLYDYADLFPAGLRTQLAEAVINRLNTSDEVEMHELLCYLRLYKTKTLPDNFKKAMSARLHTALNQNVVREAEAWGGYGLTPLSIISSPSSPFATLFEKELPLNLDYEIDQQTEEGYWSPAWSWAEMNPTAWQQAEKALRGMFTLKALQTLQAFDRLE